MSVAIIGPKFYAWGKDGKPLAFGKLYTYEARTNTPKDTYQSEDGVVANTNPVILNGEGYANVYLDGSYKVVLKDSDENEIWSADPVSASSAEEWVNCQSASYISPTQFKVTGNVTNKYDKGRRIQIDNNAAEFAYSTIVSSVFAGGETTVTIFDAVITTGIVSTCVSIVGTNSTLNKFQIGALTDYVFETVSDMQNGKPIGGSNGDVVFRIPLALKVNGENGKYINYEVVSASSDVDLGGGFWAKKLSGDVLESEVQKQIGSFSAALLSSNVGFNQIRTLGHSVIGQGSAIYQRTANVGTPSTGDESAFYDADGIQWALDPTQPIDIEMFGALHDSSDISSNLIAASNFLTSNITYTDAIGQIKTLYVPKRLSSFNVTSGDAQALTAAMSKVILVGNGDIDGIYRNTVARESDPTALSFTDVTPAHLPVFTAEASPVVVIAGDSISSMSADENGQTGLLYASLFREIVSQTGKNCTFYNRALGGRTMSGFDGTPTDQTFYPDWFIPGTPWIDQINTLNPHLVIVAFGMNDGATIDPFDIQSVRGKLKAGLNTPDIIWATTPTPHRADESDFAEFSSKSGQEGRDYAAGLVRTQAKWHKDGVIDFNRQINIIREGRDIIDTQLVRQDNVTSQPAGAYTLPRECRDFSVDLEIDTTGKVNGDPLLDFRLGRKSDNIVQLSIDASGFLKANFIVKGGFTSHSITTNFTMPIGTGIKMRISKRNNQVYIRVGEFQAEPQIFVDDAVVTGGTFFPAFGTYAGFVSGIITKYESFYGLEKRYKPSMIDNDIFGVAGPSDFRKTPAGGNGINHYSSSGLAAVVDPVLHNCKFG